ncbi:MAG: hypothetical protein IAI48_00520 [Candidatus Eremiobacteraeota bacterium]|nr:hypothetical protein [Candidatus Eremiobacteraeota bacterium]
MEGVPNIARYCDAHSEMMLGAALCPFPESGLERCHECGSAVPRAIDQDSPVHVALGKVEPPAIGRVIARFCGESCSQAWTASHPDYWNA